MNSPAEPAQPAVLVERDGPVRIFTLNRPGRRTPVFTQPRTGAVAGRA